MRKFIGWLLGYEQQLKELNQRFDELVDHVDQNAVFKDDKGLSMGNYNREQVAEHWKIFHDLAWSRLKRVRYSLFRKKEA
jgi:hypothetical protein